MENIVSRGLVIPMVTTTNKSANPVIRLRGVFMTGASWEILSKPEKARNEAAKPNRSTMGVSELCSNIFGNSEKNSDKDRWVKTVARIAMSPRNAITAPTRLTLALSRMPIQFKIPRRTSTPMVVASKERWTGPNHTCTILLSSAGTTTLRYCIPERQLMAAVRK